MKSVVHKTVYKSTMRDVAKLPYMSSWCGDQYHYEVMTSQWKNVTCIDCLSARAKKAHNRTRDLEKKQRGTYRKGQTGKTI